MSYRREFNLRDCSNSKLEELKCKYYKYLRDGEDRISGSGKYFRCPYCQDKRGKEYDMQGLLRHSYRIGYASKSSSLRGYAIVEFNCNFSGFTNAMAFAREFELDKHGKQEWQSSLKDESDDNLYAWIAGKEEYNSNSIVGNYLRRNGELKTISEIQSDNRRENSQLFSNLINELESKYKECEEMEKMISKTEVLMGNVMKEKEDMLSIHNKELEMIHQESLKQVETILSEQETSKQQLDDHEKELKLREDEIRQREKLNESEKRKLNCEKEMNERAILAQKKAYETMMELADEQKREKEQAWVKICRLERELDQKQDLELEIEMYKSAVENWRHNMDDMMEGALNKSRSLIEELREKEDELDCLLNMRYELTIKHRRVDDQVQQARKEIVNDLYGPCGNLCVKRIGELDEKPFIDAARQKYPEEEAHDKASELCSLWEEYLRDPGWHPFKVIENGRKDVGIFLNMLLFCLSHATPHTPVYTCTLFMEHW
nr:factor of DNA methylation 4-like [Ipomoea batatas]